VDWIMSLAHHFYSTIFGLLFMLLQAVTAYSVLTMIAAWRQDRGTTHLEPEAFYDVGGLLLAQIMLLAYLSFSQVVIVWAGNLPHEIGWVQPRVWGAWTGWAVTLLVLHLFLPFLVLMWGGMKRSVRRLGLVAGLVALLSPFHFFWFVIPSFHPHRVPLEPLYLLVFLVVAAIWLGCFLVAGRRMGRDS
jgi:hypothetical protein